MASFREFLKLQNDISSEIKEEIDRLEQHDNEELDSVHEQDEFPIS